MTRCHLELQEKTISSSFGGLRAVIRRFCENLTLHLPVSDITIEPTRFLGGTARTGMNIVNNLSPFLVNVARGTNHRFKPAPIYSTELLALNVRPNTFFWGWW